MEGEQNMEESQDIKGALGTLDICPLWAAVKSLPAVLRGGFPVLSRCPKTALLEKRSRQPVPWTMTHPSPRHPTRGL